MASVDFKTKTISLKIVYYGCALGGKTTNLQTLHRLTDPDGASGLVSIATKDDRTLFFDLLPMDLGQVGGLNVKVKLYTVPGQVHYELTRRQVLSGTDGVVMVVDSNSDAEVAKANAWAIENLRFNLKANGFDPDTMPTVLQWNKRDLPVARPVDEMEAELNARNLPTVEAVATTGQGVVETFAEVLKQAIVTTYAKSGRTATPEVVSRTVDEALAQAREREPKPDQHPEAAAAALFDHRFDMDAYREEQAREGRDRRIVDHESLLTESVNTNMMLAEKLEGLKQAEALGHRREQMMQALGRLAPLLADPSAAALPEGALEAMLTGAGRQRGSILLFKPNHDVMDEREVFPTPPDPLNAVASPGLGSAAYRFVKEGRSKVIEDLRSEVFFDVVPTTADGLAGALLSPLQCDGAAFGGIVVYSRTAESGFDDVEREYWHTVSTLIGLSLHWRALRRKLVQAKAS